MQDTLSDCDTDFASTDTSPTSETLKIRKFKAPVGFYFTEFVWPSLLMSDWQWVLFQGKGAVRAGSEGLAYAHWDLEVVGSGTWRKPQNF